MKSSRLTVAAACASAGVVLAAFGALAVADDDDDFEEDHRGHGGHGGECRELDGDDRCLDWTDPVDSHGSPGETTFPKPKEACFLSDRLGVSMHRELVVGHSWGEITNILGAEAHADSSHYWDGLPGTDCGSSAVTVSDAGLVPPSSDMFVRLSHWTASDQNQAMGGSVNVHFTVSLKHDNACIMSSEVYGQQWNVSFSVAEKEWFEKLRWDLSPPGCVGGSGCVPIEPYGTGSGVIVPTPGTGVTWSIRTEITTTVTPTTGTPSMDFKSKCIKFTGA
jgi:hypothetical protein